MLLTFISGMWLGAGIVMAFWAGAIWNERSMAKERRDGN
jgi:hypothetical protein